MGWFVSRKSAFNKFIVFVCLYIICNAMVYKYRRAQLHTRAVQNVTSHPAQSLTDGATNITGEHKLILFWNSFFKTDDYRFGLGHSPFVERGCPVSHCETTSDRSRLTEADAVIFHGPRIEDFPPPERPSGQIYVYVQEKPNYNPSVAYMGDFNGHMNLTMTMRRDSDIEFPHARIFRNPSKDRARRNRVNPAKRPKSIVWVVHRCSTPSRREWYVKELKNHIDVDVFGACSDNKCKEDVGEDDQECMSHFQDTYRFYLAMEYDVCRDYVSEKIYKAFKKQIIPIVFGGANYSYAAPPHSVIDIRNFSNPRDLAEYLKYLSNNEDAYNEYLEWKNTDHDVVVGREEILGANFCTLCQILHTPDHVYKDYSNIKGWWLDGICDASVIPRMRRMADW